MVGGGEREEVFEVLVREMGSVEGRVGRMEGGNLLLPIDHDRPLSALLRALDALRYPAELSRP